MLARVWGARESRIGCLGAKLELGIEFVDLGSLQSPLGWLYRRLIFFFWGAWIGLGVQPRHLLGPEEARLGRRTVSRTGASAMEPLVLHHICC